MTYHLDKNTYTLVEGSTHTPLYYIVYISLCIIAFIIIYNLWFKYVIKAIINWIKFWNRRGE